MWGTGLSVDEGYWGYTPVGCADRMVAVGECADIEYCTHASTAYAIGLRTLPYLRRCGPNRA